MHGGSSLLLHDVIRFKGLFDMLNIATEGAKAMLTDKKSEFRELGVPVDDIRQFKKEVGKQLSYFHQRI